MLDWQKSAIYLGLLEPKCCHLEELEPVVKHLEARLPFLDPFIAKNLPLFRNPQNTFPWAKYAISLALPYYHKPFVSGGFSVYCQGKDYHKVLVAMLNEYIIKLRTLYPGYSFKAFSDTGFVLDRAVALASGLGYLGENTSIIHPSYGSFIFLATVLTDLPLPKGSFLGFCKGCGACVKACPTGAIKEPYLVDNNLCISALTQKKGFLSLEHCQNISGHLFGCDICQNVCPHNQNIPSSSIITPFYLLRKPDLLRLVQMDKEYKNLLKESAANWRGTNILRRNALITLALEDHPCDLMAIKKVAENDPSHLARVYAAFCLERKLGLNLWDEALKNAPLEAHLFYGSIKNSC